MRPIDADALIKDACNNCDGWCDCVNCDCLNCKSEHRCDFVQQVLEQPTIDAVPVVRCEDCKKRRTANCPLFYGRETSTTGNDDWYCADGERKEGAE